MWIRGNGERWTAAPARGSRRPRRPGCDRAPARRRSATREVARLAGLPESHRDGSTAYWHGSPVSDVRSFLPTPAADEPELLEGVEEPRLVFGHTHLPFRRIALRGERPVELVNPGSVGMPFDGDPRAGYALVGARRRGRAPPPALRPRAPARRRCAIASTASGPRRRAADRGGALRMGGRRARPPRDGRAARAARAPPGAPARGRWAGRWDSTRPPHRSAPGSTGRSRASSPTRPFWRPASSYSIGDGKRVVVEPEVVGALGADVPAVAARTPRCAAIAAAGPALEIVDDRSRRRGDRGGARRRHLPSRGRLRRGARGRPRRSRAAAVPRAEGRAHRRRRARRGEAIGDLGALLAHVARFLDDHGASLRAGDRVICGTLVPAAARACRRARSRSSWTLGRVEARSGVAWMPARSSRA